MSNRNLQSGIDGAWECSRCVGDTSILAEHRRVYTMDTRVDFLWHISYTHNHAPENEESFLRNEQYTAAQRRRAELMDKPGQQTLQRSAPPQPHQTYGFSSSQQPQEGLASSNTTQAFPKPGSSGKQPQQPQIIQRLGGYVLEPQNRQRKKRATLFSEGDSCRMCQDNPNSVCDGARPSCSTCEKGKCPGYAVKSLGACNSCRRRRVSCNDWVPDIPGTKCWSCNYHNRVCEGKKEQRKRCLGCKQRHAQCNSEQPCQRCESLNEDCIY